MIRTRFAPSPTGLLHEGNAYSVMQCELWAQENQAELLLRIEDIDFTRCHSKFVGKMIDDLSWFGIRFDGEITYQRRRLILYQQALDVLMQRGVLYPCFCTRKQVQRSFQNHNVSQHSLDNYLGTCKALSAQQKALNMLSKPFCLRLDTQAVVKQVGEYLFWTDLNGQQHHFNITSIGDVIIGRKDIVYSYHLTVVVDDEDQGVTHVVRGEDLRSSTPAHRVLQQLLDYTPPSYHHHTLITDDKGDRLAKTKQSTTLQSLRESGETAEQLRKKLTEKGAVMKHKPSNVYA